MNARRASTLKVRVRRLLVILPWLAERGSASLAEMSERFQISEADLVADLEQAAMCGLPPFLDELVDLYIDDDGVAHIDVPRFFTRPLRLTAPEGFSLLIAGRTALALPGSDPNGPLARALAKLEAVLGSDGMVLDLAQPPATADLVAAVDDLAEVRVSYWSASSDEMTERTLAPRAVFADRGRWYLLADDDRSGDERTFRIDRILRCERTGRRVEARDVQVPSGDDWFDDLGAADVITLRIPTTERWVVERFPVRSVGDDGDHLLVELAVASEAWLREVVLRLGPHAEVVAPDEWRDLAARAAAELLAARYPTD
ncbi:MAG: WYL domain-containing protein [Acidimicrobiales bacterium]|nr:WYL domain-containing protein [Acidimicrobiales bacterium]